MEENEVVESTDNTGLETESTSPEATPAPKEPIDLDGVDKFRFAGREWTPKDFQGAYMMQSDYTRKTQALAEERKYYDNLSADLEAVKGNPSLAEKFKSIYPEKFHNYLGYVTPQQQAKADRAAGVDPEFLDRFNRLESTLKEREVAAAEAEIDAKFKTLSEKYPLADEEAVIARAQSLLSKGQKLTDQTWDAIWKSVNEKTQKLVDQIRSTQINKQKQANLKGKDVSAGGGIPGHAPKIPRSIKEASQFAIQELENQ